MTSRSARSSNVGKVAVALVLAGGAAGVWYSRQAAAPRSSSVVASSSTSAAASAAVPVAPIEPQDEEQKLFRAAQAALAAGDTDSAFSLLYEQATKYPKGALAPAREVTHATALCRAGKPAEARAEAAAFVAAHPDSPLSAEARRICAP